MAEWWPLLSPPEEYAEEAAFYQRVMLAAAGDGPLQTVLELGSGGGSNASYLKKRFSMTLVDRAPEMLAISGRLNPECDHVEGDMRRVRLGRQFDAVFVHDAIVYMTTEADLAAAIHTALDHCRPGGIVLFCPDHVRDTFAPSTDCGGHDGARRALRYLEWTWDPDPADTTYTVDYAYVLRDEQGTVRVEHDRHVEGLFARADWLRLLSNVGFRSEVVPLEHSEVATGAADVFVAKRPT
ncbi:MAG: class I SAM-dependent methyltransferase [Burkholderiales bacterium]